MFLFRLSIDFTEAKTENVYGKSLYQVYQIYLFTQHIYICDMRSKDKHVINSTLYFFINCKTYECKFPYLSISMQYHP